METYVSTKVVRAAPILAVDKAYGRVAVRESATGVHLEIPVTFEFLERHRPEPGMWLITYQDGYMSVCPDDVFRRDYTPAMAPSSEVDKVAGGLYGAYCRAVGGKAHNGDPLPSWRTFHKDASKVKQVAGWIAVAQEVLRER